MADFEHRHLVMGSASPLSAREILVALGRLDARDFDVTSRHRYGADFTGSVCLGRPAAGSGRRASPLARTSGFHVSVSAKLGGLSDVRPRHLLRFREKGDLAC